MGFFSQFKRNGNGNDEDANACGRAVSLFPSKHAETQFEPSGARGMHKAVGAKSFSHYSRDKTKASAADDGKHDSQQMDASERHRVEYTSISQFSHMISVYKGAISTVYRAKCVQTGRRLIVKIYFHEKMNPKQLHKLERELHLQKMVKHCPYVCELVAHFEENNNTNIILEDCEGGDLFKKMMKQGGCLMEAHVCTEIIVPLLRVLETLDKLNIIHRDIKPENIFLTMGGQIRLGDFGLAIDSSKEIPFYRSGTLDYMAPEVLANPCTRLEERDATMAQLDARRISPYNTKTDVWATGILAYELVTGHPPFEVDNEAETVRRIMHSEDIDLPPCYTNDWASFVRTALTKKAKKRPSASALLEHPWIVKNMSRAMTNNGHTAELERLMNPIPMCTFAQSAPIASSSQGERVEEQEAYPCAAAGLPEIGAGPLEATTSAFNGIRMVDGKGSVSFGVPVDDYTHAPVQLLTTEEKTATMQARGMKARMQLYMNRQRFQENPTETPTKVEDEEPRAKSL